MNVHINDTDVQLTANAQDIQVSADSVVVEVSVAASDVSLSCGNGDVDVVIEPPIVRQISGDIYNGEYNVTPSLSAITLGTSGKTLTRDVVVSPIPSNYGLITWNGSFLTVS